MFDFPNSRSSNCCPAQTSDSGLRTVRRVSHCFVMDVPTHSEALIITDAAVNIAPTLKEKVDLIHNAIDLPHALRFQEVRVAILSAGETVNPQFRRPGRPRYCAKWRTANRSPARSSTRRSPSTTRSVSKQPRSRGLVAVADLLRSPTNRPERKGLPRPKAGILMVEQLKPAVFEGTAVGFPLPENQGVERTSVFTDSDLNNHLVVHALLFDRHDFCGDRGHE